MAMRDLVMGGAACAVPGSDGASSSANPLGGLADSLLGGASKTQERIRELPGLAGPGQSAELGGRPYTSLPGTEFGNEFDQRASANGSQFLRGFGRIDEGGFADAWGDAVGGRMIPPVVQHDREQEEAFRNFEALYQGVEAPGRPPLALDAPPQRVLSRFFRTFLDNSHEFQVSALPPPELGLSEADKRRIRDRSSIMARHFFADQGEDYVNGRVNALLHSLDIDNSLRFREPMGGRHPELEGYWNEAIGPRPGGGPLPDTWAEDFHQHYKGSEPGGWAQEFQAQHSTDSWVDQFGEHQQQMVTRGQYRNEEVSNMAALEQTRSLVDTLSQNQDPKFQNSKFLQFVSKMSRGELIVDDNQVKPGVTNDWVNEYQERHLPPGEKWAAEFTAGEHQHRGDVWAGEFARRNQEAPSTSDDWVNDFSRMHVQDWADEYADQIAKNPYGDGSHESWLDSYDKFVGEQMADLQSRTDSSKFVYVFADQNPYVGHPNPLKEGQELFRRGLLSEAVLALEAELLKNPDNSEGWRLLGITHAENDDDKQAIASMVRARDADPTNLEVLLALGVGHTNELEQAEALRYLAGWLQNHPRYSRLVPQDVSSLSHSQVTQMVNEAAQVSPEDGDVHTVLGVLYNLSREYDRAIQSFQRALELKPRDYSLWNKLGATQANSARSADAIYAYQQALDLKPNYVRAWSNMGIGYANQGRYEESIRYYVRALGMNPKADNVWDYLKISLSSCAARWDLLDACERRDLEPLQKEYPLSSVSVIHQRCSCSHCSMGYIQH
ncbi:hypothetical protein R1flu_026231 [Riccia fluitans]|uniref:Peroxin-5 n=1 Tax=Riccia fluitans TaxID=41844 RepID=A0ABD1XFD2_9MARC